MSLDGFSMRRLVIELNKSLTGGRIDKITQPNRQTLTFSVRQPGENQLLYISIQPQNPILYRLDAPLESPAEPPTFCMVLRKQIETGRIAQIRQHGLDRIISLDIDVIGAGGRIVTKTLICELMGKYSNLILVQDGIIIDALRKVGANSSRIREVLPGEPYEIPPTQDKYDVTLAPPQKIIEKLSGLTDMKLSQALCAACLGFGPVTAKETAFSAGLSPNSPLSSLDEADYKSLENAIKETVDALSDPDSMPCLVRGEKNKIKAMSTFTLHYLPEEDIDFFPTIDAMLAKATSILGSFVPQDKEPLKKLVHTELTRAKNKLVKLHKDVEEADNAEEYRIKADNLMTYQYQLKDRADSELSLPDIYSTEGAVIKIEMDQRLTVAENIQAYYHRYNKLKRARSLLDEQIVSCGESIRYLESVEASLAVSSTLSELEDIKAELTAQGYLKSTKKKKASLKPSKPFIFTASDGTEILVGKNNYQNDRLTFKTADRDDVWLHTKDIPGSHVILRTEGAAPSDEALLLAADLAAHFSQAAGSSNIPVDYTLCRYVKKPSGAKPGFVIFTNQKTLYRTPDDKALQSILSQQQ
ncbi:MAG: NFACT family protein [Schwartzia sp.]|nr:NFACT family protein [Schwartzia sp. (in: firmicutes)]